ncbi:MAG: NAD(P)-binding protein [Candidatus Sulfotelmatobacter sp.]
MIDDANGEKLRDHFIICGYGHMGRAVADRLSRSGMPFVVIETNDELHQELLKDGVPVIHGDAKGRDVLLSAGIEQALGICIVIDNDLDNLSITNTARSINARLRIITRAGQRRYADALRKSGADEVIIPEYLGGLTVGRMIRKYYPMQSHPGMG